MRFIDRLRVIVAAGKGGKGCVSFVKSSTRGKNIPADGGNGGKGGDVIIQADARVRSLRNIANVHNAPAGRPGGGQRQRGADGSDLVVPVPCGTVILAHHNVDDGEDGESGSEQDVRSHVDAALPTSNEQLSALAAMPMRALADLTEDRQSYIAVRGGMGGRGNASFRSKPGRPAPRDFQPGESGESARLVLELKSLADVGLVGLPNAGKSTLLRALTAARPQVGAFPFTTLRPHLGTLAFSDGESLTIADIPGLIEGAHANRGLGHAFLRHVERTKALVFVVDLSAGAADGQLSASGSGRHPTGADLPPWEAVDLLRRELALYDSELPLAPTIIVANKVDRIDDAEARLHKLRSLTSMVVLPVSALKGNGLEDLRIALRSLVA